MSGVFLSQIDLVCWCLQAIIRADMFILLVGLYYIIIEF